MKVFDKYWFEKYQNILLFFLNNWIFKYWFRWLLRISRDIDYKTKIVEIAPNYFTIHIRDNEYTANIRTHNKYSKRLYYGLKYIWKIWHNFDAFKLYARNFLNLPHIEFAFDTLDYYSEAESGGDNVVCDGTIYSLNTSGETWANIRGTFDGVNLTGNTAGFAIIRCDGITNRWDYIQRGSIGFDITGFAHTATGATFNAYISGVRDDWGDNTLTILESQSATNNTLVTADNSRYGSTKFATDRAILDFTPGGYDPITLNSDALTYINANNIVKFFTIITDDYADTEPTWSSAYYCNWIIYTTDETGTGYDPFLRLTYTGAAAGNKIIGVI